jgi:hypothetical protein
MENGKWKRGLFLNFIVLYYSSLSIVHFSSLAVQAKNRIDNLMCFG